MTDLLISHLEQAIEVAKVWGPLLIIFFMAVESSFIPFPSEVVMIPAGFMAARHELFPGAAWPALGLAIVCGIVGSLAGAYANYFLASRLGRPVLYRYGKWIFLKKEGLERAEEVFCKYGDITTFVCRLIPVVRQLISIPAGLSRMSLGRFSLFTGLGAGIWVVVLSAIGFHFGRSSRQMTYAELTHAGIDLAKENRLALLGVCVLIVVIYLGVHKLVMRRQPAS